MKSVKISLQMAQNVKEFVKIVQDYPYEIDLKSDKYVVDAKSILGIFSLDLSKPLVVEIHADDCQDLIDELKKFLFSTRYGQIRFWHLKADFLSAVRGGKSLITFFTAKEPIPCRFKAKRPSTN